MTSLSPETLTTAAGGLTALGIMTAKILTEVRRVKNELTPNHGSSAKDGIDRTEAMTHEQMHILHEIQKDIGGIRVELRDLRKIDQEDRQRSDREHEQLRMEIRNAIDSQPKC